MEKKIDKELEQYRKLMEPPEEFSDGFSWQTVLGALFIGFVMMPGALYLRLLAGPTGGMDIAARWVTMILFAEIARRSFKELRMQEVYILFFMASLAMTYPIEEMLWMQYLVRSDFAQGMGIAQDIPFWRVPSVEQITQDGHTFFTRAWLAPIAFAAFVLVISKVDNFALGYVMYRITNDIEELPFPMAPVAASGITALVNTRNDKEKWRWRYFSIGGMLGLSFGAIYIGVPAITSAILAKPIQLIPLPWVDFTTNVAGFLPATPMNITFDLGSFIVGTVLPFWAVVGGFMGVILKVIANPLLYHYGVLSNWQPQMNVVDTLFSNNVDFYLAFGVGITVAVVVVSMGRPVLTLIKAITQRSAVAGDQADGKTLSTTGHSSWRRLLINNPKRGDFSVFLAMGLYACTTILWLGFSVWLIPGFPWALFVIYAVVYIPIIAYANAKLEGLCGQTISIPLIREVTFIISGYRGVAIWFAPIPQVGYAAATKDFRVLELTGTKIKSVVKTQLVTLPIVVVSVLIFSQLMWRISDVPSDAYPYAQKMWDLKAKNMCLMYSATMEGGSLFMEAWKWNYFAWGVGLGTTLFLVLSTFGMPTLLFFGLVRGLGQGMPAFLFFEMLGALTARFYLRKKFGNMWLKYAPVLLAGFGCGVGLMGMVSVSFIILTKMMSPLTF